MLEVRLSNNTTKSRRANGAWVTLKLRVEHARLRPEACQKACAVSYRLCVSGLRQDESRQEELAFVGEELLQDFRQSLRWKEVTQDLQSSLT